MSPQELFLMAQIGAYCNEFYRKQRELIQLHFLYSFEETVEIPAEKN